MNTNTTQKGKTMTDFEQLSAFKLDTGGHQNAEQGLCAMEAVAWLEGLPHSDSPECTCPVIAAFVRRMNDRMPDDVRQQLVAYLPKLVGTVSPEHKTERAEYLCWQAIRVFVPVAYRAIGLDEWAVNLEACKTFDEAKSVLNEARKAAAAYAYAAADAAAYAKLKTDFWPLVFKALDGVLEIGPSASPFSRDTVEAVAAYKALVAA